MTALKNPKYTLKAFTAKSFNDQKDSFKKLIEDAISSKDHAALFSHLEKFSGEKGLVDQAFRELGIQQVSTEIESPVEPLLSLSVECAEKGLCSIHLPVTLLSDILDCLTLDRCEKLFSWVEARVHFWQKDFFFNTCKNRILRTCNDLLRRLSRSQNTVFCGRTLVFLAKIFPLSERSGLNLNSEFNVENTTLFSSGQTAEDGELVDGVKMEEGQVEDTTSASLTVDYNLYRKFWSLQDFFRQPNNCYGKVAWKQFTTYTQEVLAALGSSKLDDDGAMRSLSSDCYFAKYLTNQKLLELELSDSNFRRYVLIQFLILFQYLQANVKSRGDVLTLTEDQTTWVKDTRTKIYQLLEATPPHGRQFAKNIQMILKREEYWNNWKNEGCPSFKAAQQPVTPQPDFQPPKKKPRLGDIVKKAEANNELCIGTPELDRLWNLQTSNWEACKAESRNYVPMLDNYFKIAIEQSDPDAGIEERYKSVNDISYSWRALRLLALRTTVLFMPPGTPPPKNLGRFLELTINRLAKELPTVEETTGAVEETSEEEGEEELLKNTDPDPPSQDTINTIMEDNPLSNKSHLTQLAELVGKEWKGLARKLGFEDDELPYLSEGGGAANMLLVWLEQQPSTSKALQTLERSLGACGLTSALEYLLTL